MTEQTRIARKIVREAMPDLSDEINAHADNLSTIRNGAIGFGLAIVFWTCAAAWLHDPRGFASFMMQPLMVGAYLIEAAIIVVVLKRTRSFTIQVMEQLEEKLDEEKMAQVRAAYPERRPADMFGPWMKGRRPRFAAFMAAISPITIRRRTRDDAT